MARKDKKSRTYKKLKHSEYDIYKIIKQLDSQTGLQGRHLDIYIDNSLGRTLGSFHYTSTTLNYEEIQSETVKQEWKNTFGDMQSIKVPTKQDEFYFVFNEEVLEWDYDLLFQVVCHEYAHMVERTKPFALDPNYVSHGPEFAEIVRELGGRGVSTSIDQDLTAVERSRMNIFKYDYFNKIHPYQVRVFLRDEEADDYYEHTIIGYKYNSKAYKSFVELLKQYDKNYEFFDYSDGEAYNFVIDSEVVEGNNWYLYDLIHEKSGGKVF